MDPLDPLTEIINSGQAFSPAIVLERIVWIMMAFFLIGAFSTSIINGMKHQDWFRNKSFLFSLNSPKPKEKLPRKLSDDDK